MHCIVPICPISFAGRGGWTLVTRAGQGVLAGSLLLLTACDQEGGAWDRADAGVFQPSAGSRVEEPPEDGRVGESRVEALGFRERGVDAAADPPSDAAARAEGMAQLTRFPTTLDALRDVLPVPPAPDTGSPVADAVLMARVEEALSRDPVLQSAWVSVEVAGGQVRLSGLVEGDNLRRHAVALVGAVAGPDNVVDKLAPMD